MIARYKLSHLVLVGVTLCLLLGFFGLLICGRLPISIDAHLLSHMVLNYISDMFNVSLLFLFFPLACCSVISKQYFLQICNQILNQAILYCLSL